MFKGILNIALATAYQVSIQTLNLKTSESSLTKDIAQKVCSEFSAQKNVSFEFELATNLLKHDIIVTPVFEFNKCKTLGISFFNFQHKALIFKCIAYATQGSFINKLMNKEFIMADLIRLIQTT